MENPEVIIDLIEEEKKEEAKLRNCKSDYYQKSNKMTIEGLDKAILDLSDAITILSKKNLSPEEALCCIDYHFNLGVFYRDKSDFEASQQHFEKAVVLILNRFNCNLIINNVTIDNGYFIKLLRDCFTDLTNYHSQNSSRGYFYLYAYSCFSKENWSPHTHQKTYNLLKEIPADPGNLREQFYYFYYLILANETQAFLQPLLNANFQEKLKEEVFVKQIKAQSTTLVSLIVSGNKETPLKNLESRIAELETRHNSIVKFLQTKFQNPSQTHFGPGSPFSTNKRKREDKKEELPELEQTRPHSPTNNYREE